MNVPTLLDSTLRDGEQAPGVCFTLVEKLDVAQRLDRWGIDVIEAGIPAMGGSEREFFRILATLPIKAEVSAWNRLSRKDVEASLESNARSLHLSVPVSPVLLEAKFRGNTQRVFDELSAAIALVRSAGARFSIGAEDASRADPAFFEEVVAFAEEHGALRLRYADTLGILTPETTSAQIQRWSSRTSIPIDFHGHNDFGLATANALAAWRAGARVLSCTVLGIGERAGNSRLEEVAASLRYLYRTSDRWDLAAIQPLVKLVARYARRRIALDKPLFGANAFRHESGIHVDALSKNAQTYEAVSPRAFGKRRSIVLGKHSGSAFLVKMAKARGVELSSDRARAFLLDLRGRLENDKKISARKLFEAFLDSEAAP